MHATGLGPHSTVAVAALSAAAGPTSWWSPTRSASGVVAAHRSGRLFRDLLGIVNQTLAAACDEVHLVVAGRVLRL